MPCSIIRKQVEGLFILICMSSSIILWIIVSTLFALLTVMVFPQLEKFKILINTHSSGNPGHGIIKQAKEVHADLIVMGTRGLGAIRRTILGSVSDYVLHHSHIPVAICHQ